MEVQSGSQRQSTEDVDPNPIGVQRELISDFAASTGAPAQIVSQAATLQELRAEVAHLRGERDRLSARQREIAGLLKCSSPDKVVHDLRNLLNELQLYRMLVDTQRA